MTNKDEEQLLQDASTLLMFANVAAKQQLNQPSPTSNVSSPPTIQQQLQSQPQAPRVHQRVPQPRLHRHGQVLTIKF